MGAVPVVYTAAVVLLPSGERMSTIALHHILVKSPLLAEDILRELQLGAEFGDLAAEYSACPSARQSVRLPTLPPGEVGNRSTKLSTLL